MRSKLMQILASVTMVAIAATGVTVVTATSAEAAEGQLQSYRACEELDVQMTDRHPGECVNGGRIASRGYGVATCLAQVNKPDENPGFRYPRNTCTSERAGVQAERIAQARFIQSLDGDNRANGWGASKQIYTPQLAVHPGVQWEVTPAIRALRADVLNYRPALNDSGKPVAFPGDPADNPMDLWELKVATPNSKSREAVLTSAAKQAESYAKLLKADMAYGVPRSLWDKIHAATSYSGYVDFFVIEKQRCDQVDKNGKPVKTAIDWDFNVSGSPQYAGALVVERTDVESKCTDRREPSKETKDIKVKEPYSVGTPSLLDIVIDSLGHCGTSCLPSMPRIPSPVKQRMYADTAMFATDASGIEYWQRNSSAVCAAIASIERVKGTATPVADLCERTLTFTELINSQEFGSFWNVLDVKDILELLKSMFSVFSDDTQSNVSNPARVNGDPHLVTLDGLNYDLQSVGEFDLLEVPERELDIQARFVAAGTQSSTSAIATTWGDQTVELRADGTVLVNGEIQKIAPGSGIKFDEDEIGYFLNDNGTYRLSWPGDEEGSAPVELSWQPMNASLGNLGVVVPPGVATRGLLGNNDGKASNDLSTREGAAVDPTDTVGIHDAYADSWRIVDAASLFTYGRGESTATYTDRSFPQQIVTTGDFPVPDQAAAQQACDAAGVVAGPSFRNCVLDVLVTRNNDFALAFTGIDDTSRSADDKVMNADGKLTEAFSSATVAPNLRPLRSSKDDAYGDVAGPFNGSEQYRFHVPDLPRHDNVTVAFDLIALGQWDTADAVAIRLDSQPAVPLDLTNATPGVLGDGTPIRTKRISMSLDHYRELVGATLAGSGLTGAQRFAVDNLEVTAHVVAPDVFSPQLEAGVSTELRAPTLSAGAGVLERWGARDQYTVQLARQDVLLDWLTRSESVKWTLTKSTNGEVVAGGVSSDGNQRLRNLDGTYVLTVEGTGDAQPTSEAYSLNMLLTPKAERFTFELPGPVQLPADLPSPAVANGAGALETKLSTDLYAFAVTGKDRSVTINPTLCPTQNYRQRLSWTLLDGNGAAVDAGNCWSRTVTGLQAGDYTLRVDPERETTGTYRITVTGNGPTTTFDPSPAEASNKKSQTVSFAGTAEATAFECAIDAPSYTGPFSACSSPKTFSDLADGDHTIQVRAKDKDGNLGPAIKHLVTVDTAVPNMQITRKPPAQSNINGPVLEYSAEKRGMTYQCSLVPVGTTPSFEGCSGVSVYRDLKHGTYRFTVVGTDWVGNESTISYDFMVDLEPPVIDLVPPSNLTSTNAPQFTFTANEKATYECSLVLTSQPDAFTPCTSPKQYTGLSDGSQYRFLVKATDVAGQWSARGVTWTPYATPPSVTITSKPATSSSNAAPSFAFTSTMANPTFDCSLELASATASFSSCTSPKTYSGKAAGTYKFTVKATDASGSWVSSTYQFTITAASSDTQAPSTPGTPTAVIAPAVASIGGDTDTPKAGIPLRISWTGSTDNVGVAGYQLWYSTNGAAYVNAGNTTGTAVTMNVAPGSTNLRFQIKAYDAAGNTSTASTASTATTVALDQETAASTLLTYSGTWTSASAASYSGGTAKYASATSAAATYKAPSGTTQVAVVMATGPSAGRATIAVDGGTATTVDLYSSTAGYRTVALSTANLSATSAHTVVVKPAGTKNTSSSGTRVDLDAFVTRR